MKKLSGLIAILCFASCDPVYQYSYEVTNNADSEIRVFLKENSYSSSNDRVQIFVIDRLDSKVVLTTSHGVEPPDGPYFDDVIHDLDSFVVVKNNTLISHRDYLDNSAWSYENGLYSTTVTDDEFE